ncbi:MAG: DUF469 family protein [Acidobacteria bacterium]|nr:DUF469 family protein [Acidobacteriota bacterium]
MKKRLRKKLRVGEFQEFGFRVSLKFKDEIPPAEFEDFLVAFLNEAVEANNLLYVEGGMGEQWACFLISDTARTPITDAQRDAVQQWAQANALVAACELGPLVDAWYGKWA